MEHITYSGEASAPGKVIISGEHSAVYGHPVLLMALNRRLTCHFKCHTISTPTSFIVTAGGSVIYDSSLDQIAKNEGRLLEYALNKFIDVPSFNLTVAVSSEIPMGAGLGSSAAYAAALSACIALTLGKLTSQNLDCLDDLIFDFTNCMERFQHGKPSGCDAACIIKGGTISYQLKEPPESTIVKSLGFAIDKLKVFIVYTGKQRDTKQLVSQVAKFKAEKPDDFQELIKVISDVSSEMIELIQESNLDKYAILDYVSMNQQYLQELGVSSPEIDDIVAICMENEVHAKLTGAGGGGCVLCLPKQPDSDLTALFKQFESKGYTVFDKVQVSQSGLTYSLDNSKL